MPVNSARAGAVRLLR